VANTNLGTLRISIRNSHTGALSTGSVARVDIFNGANVRWTASPAGGVLAAQNSTSTGTSVMSVTQGSYTVFGFLTPAAAPIPNNGIGSINVNFAAGQDFFLTTYYVPVTIFPDTASRAVVLSWQSKDEGMSYPIST